jgi:hypothetical protein
MAKENANKKQYKKAGASPHKAGKAKALPGTYLTKRNAALNFGGNIQAAYKSSGPEAASLLGEPAMPYIAMRPAEQGHLTRGMVVRVHTKAAEQNLTCLITEVSGHSITVQALIDKRKGIAQTRRFDIAPLRGVIDCAVGNVFNLTIVTSPGRREFLYTPGNPNDSKYFEETLVDITSLRNDLKNDPIFRQGPDTDDGHTF